MQLREKELSDPTGLKKKKKKEYTLSQTLATKIIQILIHQARDKIL